VWLSGIVYPGGPPADVVQLALKKKFQLVISDSILKEIERHLLGKFQVEPKIVNRLLYRIGEVADTFTPTGNVKIIPNKHPDNLVLETAY
jgi:putative PIN family toxin of toxin-antitoxin system